MTLRLTLFLICTISVALFPGTASADNPDIHFATRRPETGAVDLMSPAAVFPSDWDTFSEWGLTALWKGPRAAFRGFLTAIRDILFPVRTVSNENESPFPEEDPSEFAMREYFRITLLHAARDFGVIRLHESNPDAVRYGFAGFFGIACIMFFLALQAGAAACGRLTTGAILKWVDKDVSLETSVGGIISKSGGSVSGESRKLK